MLHQAAVTIAEDRERRVTEEVLDTSHMPTEELLDHVDGNDMFTPVALKVFLAKGENGKSKTDPGLVDR